MDSQLHLCQLLHATELTGNLTCYRCRASPSIRGATALGPEVPRAARARRASVISTALNMMIGAKPLGGLQSKLDQHAAASARGRRASVFMSMVSPDTAAGAGGAEDEDDDER